MSDAVQPTDQKPRQAATGKMPPATWLAAADRNFRSRRMPTDPRLPKMQPHHHRYPDFYIVGPQKTGTTWLSVQLRMHPQVWSPLVKEILYFDEYWSGGSSPWMRDHRLRQLNDSIRPSELVMSRHNNQWNDDYIEDMKAFLSAPPVMTDAWYAKFFADCGVDQLCYDASTSYVTLPHGGLAHMRRLSPHAKIIVLVRDPVDRIWSFLRMLMKAQQNDSLEFQRELLRKNAVFLYRSSDYGRIYDNFASVFGRDNVLAMSYRSIADTPHTFLESMCRFVSIEYSPDLFYNAATTVFEGPSKPMSPEIATDIRAFLADLKPSYLDKFGELAQHWVL